MGTPNKVPDSARGSAELRFPRETELRALLIKPPLPGARGKECQLRRTQRRSVILTGTLRGAGSPRFPTAGPLDFPSAICQKAGNPRSLAILPPLLRLCLGPYPAAAVVVVATHPRDHLFHRLALGDEFFRAAVPPFQTNSPRFTLPASEP